MTFFFDLEGGGSLEDGAALLIPLAVENRKKSYDDTRGETRRAGMRVEGRVERAVEVNGGRGGKRDGVCGDGGGGGRSPESGGDKLVLYR